MRNLFSKLKTRILIKIAKHILKLEWKSIYCVLHMKRDLKGLEKTFGYACYNLSTQILYLRIVIWEIIFSKGNQR